MPLQVLKFGGSVLDRPEVVATIVRIVLARASAAPTVVVVSALKSVTDRLYSAVAAAESGDPDRAAATLDGVGDLHCRFADASLLGDATGRYRELCRSHVERLAEICRAVAVLGAATPRARDEIVGAGERLAAVLVAEALRDASLDAEPVDAADVVVVEETETGVVDYARTRRAAAERVGALATAGRVPVVTGFVAATRDGHPATLGRGGSDLTAAVLARVLEAESVVFFKDVDGIYSADPQLFADACVQPSLSYEEARELAALGARFLHPHALAPLLGRATRIEFRSAARPDVHGTLVVHDGAAASPEIRAVVASGDLCAVAVVEDAAAAVKSFRGRAVSALSDSSRSALVVADAIGGGASLSVIVRAGHALGVKAALEGEFGAEIASGVLRPVRLEWGLVAASIVGDGVAGSPRLAAAAISALAERGAAVRAVSRSASGTSLRIVLDGCSVEEAISALHTLVSRGARLAVFDA